MNTVRPPHHGYISFAESFMATPPPAIDAASGAAWSRAAPAPSSEIAGAAVTVSGALFSPYA